eukprot:IDg18924t1
MASSVLPIYGAVGTSLSLLDRSLTIFKAWRARKEIEADTDNVCELYERVKRVLTLVHRELSQSDSNERKTRLETLLQPVNDHIKQVESAVTRLNAVAENAKKGELHKHVRRAAGAVLEGLNKKSLSSSYEEVKKCITDAANASAKITMYLDLSEQIQRISPRAVESQFKPSFDKPEIPPNAVLDFESPETSEGRLLGTLMSLSRGDGERGVSALGAQGMGGVGKTTALRALCRKKQVCEEFTDGVCFLEFGQDATDRKVINEVKRCIENLGGKMEQANTVDQVVEQERVPPENARDPAKCPEERITDIDARSEDCKKG